MKMAVTVATCELTIIFKNQVRLQKPCQFEEQLSDLAMLSIENQPAGNFEPQGFGE